MAEKEYIEREAFLEQKREQYCKDCARRKGMKNGKYKTLYEIGEAPCRACGIDDMLNDVEDFPAADVRPVKWIPVTELLPKTGEIVLVYGKRGGIYTAEHNRSGRWPGSFWKLNSKSHHCEPTHWMPLPEPPKEET